MPQSDKLKPLAPKTNEKPKYAVSFKNSKLHAGNTQEIPDDLDISDEMAEAIYKVLCED